MKFITRGWTRRFLPMAAAYIFVSIPVGAQVVQDTRRMESPAAAELNRSLSRLAQDPGNLSALITAGESTLALDDARAATGFFARAEELDPRNGRVKAGMGKALLLLERPTEALRLLEEATQLGLPERDLVAERALAYDFAGDTVRAERDYQAALRLKPADPELIRNYAVSLGIAGRVDEAEKLIEPLLYKGDREAWRDRAFILAMNGKLAEARKVTQAVMPKPLADSIEPYMVSMPRLDAAQRAAAVHLGQFPAGLQAMAPVVPVIAPAANAETAKLVKADKAPRTRIVAQTERAALPSSSSPPVESQNPRTDGWVGKLSTPSAGTAATNASVATAPAGAEPVSSAMASAPASRAGSAAPLKADSTPRRAGYSSDQSSPFFPAGTGHGRTVLRNGAARGAGCRSAIEGARRLGRDF